MATLKLAMQRSRSRRIGSNMAFAVQTKMFGFRANFAVIINVAFFFVAEGLRRRLDGWILRHVGVRDHSPVVKL